MVRWLLGLAVVLVLAASGYAVFERGWFRRAAPKYLTAQVTRGRVETMVNSTGTIKPVRSVSVGAFTSGPIAEILVDFNSVVKKGDVLARIDPRLLTATRDRDAAFLRTQKAERARVEALLQQARNNEGRARRLRMIDNNYLSDVEMDQFHFGRLTYEAQRDLAIAAIAQAEATLKNSEANLGYTKIISPVDGIVIERKVDPGQTVAASFQTPELFIVAPDMEKHMHVFASVDEADIGLIRTAQEKHRTARFTVDAYPGDLFQGEIYQIRKSSTTTQNVVTYPVVIEAKNPELKLLPGMTANISFPIEAKDNVLRVPAIALRFQPLAAQIRPEDRHYVEAVAAPADSNTRRSAHDKVTAARNRSHRVVWVQDGALLRAVPVTLGLAETRFVEIVAGDLTEDEEVVIGVESRK